MTSGISPRSADIAHDLKVLQRIDSATLKSLAPTLSKPTSTASASDLLDTFTPGSTDLEASQGLIKSYVRDMKTDVLSGDRTLEEGLAQRIDQVREKGGGIQAALGDVTV